MTTTVQNEIECDRYFILYPPGVRDGTGYIKCTNEKVFFDVKYCKVRVPLRYDDIVI